MGKKLHGVQFTKLFYLKKITSVHATDHRLEITATSGLEYILTETAPKIIPVNAKDSEPFPELTLNP